MGAKEQSLIESEIGDPSTWYNPSMNPQANIQQALASQSSIPSAPQMPLTFGQKAANVGNDIVSGLNKYVAQPIDTGVGSAIEGVTQGVADIANTPVLGQALAPLTALVPNMQGIKAPFVNENSLTGKIIKTVAPFVVPEMGAKSAVGALGIEGFRGANILRNILTQAGTGYLGTNGNQADRATNALIGGTLGGAASTALKVPGAINALRKLPTDFVDNRARDMVATLAQGNTPKPSNALNDFLGFAYNKFLGNPNASKMAMPDFTDINQINGSKVIASSENQKQIWGKAFQDLESSAINKGYIPNAKIDIDPYSGTSEKTGKIINTSEATSNAFNNLLEPDSESLIKSVSPTTKKLIINFKRNPSYTNAHALQSALGQEGSEFSDILGSDPGDKATASALHNTRDLLNKDISTTFTKNGDDDLDTMLTNARNGWRENVIPYQEAPGIGTMVRSGNIPKNVLDLLSKTDTTGQMDTIRNHIMDDQGFRNSLLAQQLMTRTQGITKPNVGAHELTGQYEKIPNVLYRLHTPETGNALKILQHQHETAKTIQRGITGIGGLTGGYELLHHLGL